MVGPLAASTTAAIRSMAAVEVKDASDALELGPMTPSSTPPAIQASVARLAVTPDSAGSAAGRARTSALSSGNALTGSQPLLSSNTNRVGSVTPEYLETVTYTNASATSEWIKFASRSRSGFGLVAPQIQEGS
ncbi:unnamed protein product [Phytophthora fragariaefolia]|uniref:Unnamed protein product n=1 Tax=Phytophthora fragariaefolia TaxID=1490495 RepID=A0A9W6XML5_9STRA|nr:unnamed protein product [Phytophthora fragariaefolia]